MGFVKALAEQTSGAKAARLDAVGRMLPDKLPRQLRELQRLIGTGDLFVSARGVPSLIVATPHGKLSFCYFAQKRFIRMFTNARTTRQEFEEGQEQHQARRDFDNAALAAAFLQSEYGIDRYSAQIVHTPSPG